MESSRNICLFQHISLLYLNLCVFHSVYPTPTPYIPYSMYPIPCIPLCVCPTPCISHSVYPTPCIFHSVYIPFCAYPTPCVSNSICIQLHIYLTPCVPLLYLTPLYPTPCPTPCVCHFMRVPFCACLTPISYSECPTSFMSHPMYRTSCMSYIVLLCSTSYTSHFLWISLSVHMFHVLCVCCSDGLRVTVSLPLLVTWSRPWIPFSRPSDCAFSSVITLRESPGNSWTNNCISIFDCCGPKIFVCKDWDHLGNSDVRHKLLRAAGTRYWK